MVCSASRLVDCKVAAWYLELLFVYGNMNTQILLMGWTKPCKLMGYLPYQLMQDLFHQQYHPNIIIIPDHIVSLHSSNGVSWNESPPSHKGGDGTVSVSAYSILSCMTYLASTSIFSCLISSPTIPCGGKHGTYIHITYKSVYSNNGPNISQTNRHDSSRMVSILPKWRQDVVKGRHTSGGSSHIPRHLGVLPGVHHGRLNQNAIGCKEDFLNHQNSTYSLYRFIAMYTVLYVYMNIYIYIRMYI